jgi:REP element-mobilizing transposase RayT
LDRKRFVETLGEACAKTDWQVHALCLMGNHFHLVVETPKGNLVAGMKWFLGTYTSRFNRRHLGMSSDECRMSNVECRMSKADGVARLAGQNLRVGCI